MLADDKTSCSYSHHITSLCKDGRQNMIMHRISRISLFMAMLNSYLGLQYSPKTLNHKML